MASGNNIPPETDNAIAAKGTARDGHVIFSLDSYSRSELKLLRTRLVSDLKRVRSVIYEVESRESEFQLYGSFVRPSSQLINSISKKGGLGKKSEKVLGQKRTMSLSWDPVFSHQIRGSDVMTADAWVKKGKRSKKERGHRTVGWGQMYLPLSRSEPEPVHGSDDIMAADTPNQSVVKKEVVKLPRGSRRGAKRGKGRPSWLPRDWKIIRRPRKNGASAGVVDKYYVEPVTRTKLRSMSEVKRYLKIFGEINDSD